jgi:2-methylaconitate cis-trans-isomerase PrpF
MHEIPATWMRGGTSKCWVFRRADLQVGDLSIDDVLLRLYGSPDHRQVDGVGGGTSTTSKAVILAPSELDGVDVEYTFAQVGIDEAKVDWGSNCGNCSAVVASFAIREGWVPTNDGETAVRVLNTNTDQLIVQRVDTPGAQLLEAATENIPGVPFPGAPVRMGFVDPAGRSTGQLFPTGRVSDAIEVAQQSVTVTLVDAGAPVVAVSAADFGVEGDEDTHELDATPGLLARLEVVRRQAGVLMGLADTTALVARAVPKLAMVSSPAREEDTDLTVRMLSMGRFHPAVPVTGSVALTLAAGVPGTVVHDLARGDAAAGLRLGTPAGCVTTFVEEHDSVPVVGVIRTYRRLAHGSVLLPDAPLLPTGSA